MRTEEPHSNLTLGIMQPYLFPYIGYFQYIASTDRFVIYDDVHFIMRGWINRNRILVQGREHLFSVPLANASPNRLIREVRISPSQDWQDPLTKTLRMAYGKAPHFSESMDIILPVIDSDTASISDLARESITAIIHALKIKTDIVLSSTVYGNSSLDRMDRIIDICRREGATSCVVPMGGASMYPKSFFRERGVSLSYISPQIEKYRQYGSGQFVPSLSIIDVLMWNGTGRTAEMIMQGELK